MIDHGERVQLGVPLDALDVRVRAERDANILAAKIDEREVLAPALDALVRRGLRGHRVIRIEPPQVARLGVAVIRERDLAGALESAIERQQPLADIERERGQDVRRDYAVRGITPAQEPGLRHRLQREVRAVARDDEPVADRRALVRDRGRRAGVHLPRILGHRIGGRSHPPLDRRSHARDVIIVEKPRRRHGRTEHAGGFVALDRGRRGGRAVEDVEDEGVLRHGREPMMARRDRELIELEVGGHGHA